MLLLMYAMFLAMNHPMTNVYRNIGVMSNSITCGQEKALNETKDLIKACVAPMQSLFQATSKHVLVKVRLYTLSWYALSISLAMYISIGVFEMVLSSYILNST